MPRKYDKLPCHPTGKVVSYSLLLFLGKKPIKTDGFGYEQTQDIGDCGIRQQWGSVSPDSIAYSKVPLCPSLMHS